MKTKTYENIQKEKSFQMMVLMESLIGSKNMQKFIQSWFMYNSNI